MKEIKCPDEKLGKCGDIKSYRKGCRGENCKKANAEYQRDYQIKRKEKANAEAPSKEQ